MTPDRETLAAALAHWFRAEDALQAAQMVAAESFDPADCWLVLADALLAGPLAPLPSGGEADEAAGRVAALAEALDAHGIDGAWSVCPSVREQGAYEYVSAADLRLLLADRERLAGRPAGG